MSELTRIELVRNRDGEAAAVEFCRRTLQVYRRSVLMTEKNGRKFHHASLPQYRKLFIRSYCEFKRYLSVAAQ